jgi:RNA polymerase subunit RPABC4/transcription elongation factor Spt4
MNQPATCNACKSAVHPEAKRCPHCTTWIDRPMTSYWSFWLAAIAVAVVLLGAYDALAVPVNVIEVGDSGF